MKGLSGRIKRPISLFYLPVNLQENLGHITLINLYLKNKPVQRWTHLQNQPWKDNALKINQTETCSTPVLQHKTGHWRPNQNVHKWDPNNLAQELILIFFLNDPLQLHCRSLVENYCIMPFS